MEFKFNKLNLGIVEYEKNNRIVTEVHTLYDDENDEELWDLTLCEYVLPYGDGNRYYSKSLIPFSTLMFNSRVIWSSLSREDALKLSYYHNDLYFRLLKYKGICTIDDLAQEEVEYKRERK